MYKSNIFSKGFMVCHRIKYIYKGKVVDYIVLKGSYVDI